MSQENVTRFREATEAFNRGDVDAWLGFYDESCVFEPQVAAIEGTYAGHDGVREFIRTIGELYETFQVHLEEVRDLGDRVLALGTATGLGKRSGIEHSTPLAILARFENGRITRFKDFGDKARALEAAGVVE